MKWTIVRPTLAYNENGGEEFNMFLAYLKRYPFVPFIGAGRSLKRPVHCDDLMKGFLAIAGNSKAYGKTYAFSGGEAIAIRDMAKLMLKHVHQEKPFVTIPIPICRIIALFAERLQKKPILTWNAIAGVMQDANLDNREAQSDLGYSSRQLSGRSAEIVSHLIEKIGRALRRRSWFPGERDRWVSQATGRPSF